MATKVILRRPSGGPAAARGGAGPGDRKWAWEDDDGEESQPAAAEAAPEPVTEDAPGTVAYEIRTTTDALNEGLEDAEKALVALNLGTEGAVRMNIGGGEFWSRWLAFRKTRDGWKLLIEDAHDHEDRMMADPMALLSAPRDVRIAAAAELNELLSLLLKDSSERLTRLREAVDHVETFRARINDERNAR